MFFDLSVVQSVYHLIVYLVDVVMADEADVTTTLHPCENFSKFQLNFSVKISQASTLQIDFSLRIP